MSGLSPEERETLAAGVHGITCHLVGGGSCGDVDEFDREDADYLAATVDHIANERVRTALEAAAAKVDARFNEATADVPYEPFPADLTDSERSGWLDGLRSAARIVRAAADTT